VIAALVGEGSSDQVLMPILRSLLERLTEEDVRLEWIDTLSFPARPRTLVQKVSAARRVCRCELLFVHRDADNQPPECRYKEIHEAAGDQVHVAVVPVRTTEAWLMIDEAMIRVAAGRPSGNDNLDLPTLRKLEAEPKPKERLATALRRAQGATGRRASRFHVPTAVRRLADLIEDWSPLLTLRSFKRLESDTRKALDGLDVTLVGGPG